MTSPEFSAAAAEMRGYLQRIATGPELSKDLDRAEARAGMGQILTGDADPVQAALFLIALRMKRESEDEESGVLDALLEVVEGADVDVDDLVEVADPYDGFVRGTPASSFLPPLLAALGVPAVLTGARSVGPKYGVTHSMILEAAGVDVRGSPERVARGLEDAALGWVTSTNRVSVRPCMRLSTCARGWSSGPWSRPSRSCFGRCARGAATC